MATTIGLVYHNLSLMLSAGLPMVRSLNTVASGLQSYWRMEFARLAEGVANGNSLAEMMARKPRVFEPLDITLIRAAETSGTLPETLQLLADWHEFSQRAGRKMLSGLLLPVVLVHAVAFVAPLPGFFLGGWDVDSYIRSVIAILSIFYIPAAIIFCILRLTPKTGPLRQTLDRIALKIPVLGQGLYKLALSRYCWVFHMLAKAGLPATDCAEKAADSAGNAVITDRVKGGAASVRQGRPVSEGFSTRLPPEFIDLWHIGEETGRMDEITKKLADNYGQDAEYWLTEFAVWLPRVAYFIVILGMIFAILAGVRMIYGHVL
jgi:type IV pilus assembly protein PilC